mgnify:CR=1 FL=1
MAVWALLLIQLMLGIISPVSEDSEAFHSTIAVAANRGAIQGVCPLDTSLSQTRPAETKPCPPEETGAISAWSIVLLVGRDLLLRGGGLFFLIALPAALGEPLSQRQATAVALAYFAAVSQVFEKLYEPEIQRLEKRIDELESRRSPS